MDKVIIPKSVYNRKVELRKKFNEWLGDEFDKKNKSSPRSTHRWIFCYDGQMGEDSLSFDCACCLTADESEGCGCHCHSRIGEIVDFFWEELAGESLFTDEAL
ncbi:hypothetical protein A2Z67_04820 [Candidatus Woesebacteria bacterium RBG_13_36_22]|uniref:Uncharacterized protein n=1 Tax=Candidatus Woesebacteria bacterium RBG_13_36_22 TaxID=1802478 RepID=A0A1F7X2X7_9BACT|nr:MAG: hypothetical protein A2Z67_04820 [Candidatus Woesebacteria bacterium RBG_13_36_22]